MSKHLHKAVKPHHRVQSSGNGRQPWKKNDYQAVNEGDKGSASRFWALWLLLVRAAVVTYRRPRAMISRGQSTFGNTQSPFISAGSHYTKGICTGPALPSAVLFRHLGCRRTDNQADRHSPFLVINTTHWLPSSVLQVTYKSHTTNRTAYECAKIPQQSRLRNCRKQIWVKSVTALKTIITHPFPVARAITWSLSPGTMDRPATHTLQVWGFLKSWPESQHSSQPPPPHMGSLCPWRGQELPPPRCSVCLLPSICFPHKRKLGRRWTGATWSQPPSV